MEYHIRPLTEAERRLSGSSRAVWVGRERGASDPRSLTFLSGQDSYPTPRFPRARIDYIDILSPQGVCFLSTRSCKGTRLPGTLEDVEVVLRDESRGS